MSDQERVEYIPELDLLQFCLCCGRPMWVDLPRERMQCTTPGCPNRGITFTIPRKAVVVRSSGSEEEDDELGNNR